MAGNTLSVVAPAPKAAKASVGVATPELLPNGRREQPQSRPGRSGALRSIRYRRGEPLQLEMSEKQFLHPRRNPGEKASHSL